MLASSSFVLTAVLGLGDVEQQTRKLSIQTGSHMTQPKGSNGTDVDSNSLLSNAEK